MHKKIQMISKRKPYKNNMTMAKETNKLNKLSISAIMAT